MIFVLIDHLPTVIFGKLHGDNALSAGIKFSALWPVALAAAYFMSNLEFYNGKFFLNKEKNNIFKFLAYALIFTFITTSIIHVSLMRN